MVENLVTLGAILVLAFIFGYAKGSEFTEDIKRLTIMNEDYQDYLHNRIAALESRVQFLKEQLELSKQSNLKE